MRTRAAILLAVGAICGVIAAITLRSATDRGTPTAPAAQVAPARQVPAAPAHTPAVDTGRWVATWSAPPLTARDRLAGESRTWRAAPAG